MWRDFYVSGQDNIFRYYIITWLDGNENYIFIGRTLFLSYRIPDTRRALSNRGQPKIYFNDRVPNLWSIVCRISICHRVIDFYRRFNLHLLASATGEQIRMRDFSWIAIKRVTSNIFSERDGTCYIKTIKNAITLPFTPRFVQFTMKLPCGSTSSRISFFTLTSSRVDWITIVKKIVKNNYSIVFYFCNSCNELNVPARLSRANDFQLRGNFTAQDAQHDSISQLNIEGYLRLWNENV